MTGCSSMVLPRADNRSSEAVCGGWFLNMYPNRPSEVGLSSTSSRPRSSAPCGSIDTSAIGSAAAGVIPTAVAAVPSEAAAVPCRKRRRLIAPAFLLPH